MTYETVVSTQTHKTITVGTNKMLLLSTTYEILTAKTPFETKFVNTSKISEMLSLVT